MDQNQSFFVHIHVHKIAYTQSTWMFKSFIKKLKLLNLFWLVITYWSS